MIPGMNKARKLVVSTLIAGGLNKPSAENYEKAIYMRYPDEEDYISIVYDKIGQLRSAGDRVEREKILNDIKNKIESWDACVYVTSKEKYEASLDTSKERTKPIKGMYKCKEKECGSDEFYVWQEQRRRSDEAATIMRQCAKCGKRGKEN